MGDRQKTIDKKEGSGRCSQSLFFIRESRHAIETFQNSRTTSPVSRVDND